MSEVVADIVNDFASERRSFDIDDVLAQLKERVGLPEAVYEAVGKAVKFQLMRTFEEGGLIGYCIGTKYALDSDGDFKTKLEFRPITREFNVQDLSETPKDAVKLICRVDKLRNEEIKVLAKKFAISKEAFLRILLTRALDLIEDD